MATMNTVETQNFVKTSAIASLNLEGATQIGQFTYAIPVEVEGKTRYAKLTLTCTNDKDTKTTEAFNLEKAVKAFEAECEERAEKAREKAEAKAAKEAKKNSKTSK